MNTNQKKVGIGFWLAWVLANILGFGVGAVLGIAMFLAIRVAESISLPIVFAAIFSIVGGLAQWMIIASSGLIAGEVLVIVISGNNDSTNQTSSITPIPFPVPVAVTTELQPSLQHCRPLAWEANHPLHRCLCLHPSYSL
jgi:hypothetical protein